MHPFEQSDQEVGDIVTFQSKESFVIAKGRFSQCQNISVILPITRQDARVNPLLGHVFQRVAAAKSYCALLQLLDGRVL
jgi:hypothetical protein